MREESGGGGGGEAGGRGSGRRRGQSASSSLACLLLPLLLLLSAWPTAEAASGMRLCGDKLVKIVSRMCNNCLAAPQGIELEKKDGRLAFLAAVGADPDEEALQDLAQSQELRVEGPESEALLRDFLHAPLPDSPRLHHLLKRTQGGIANRCCRRKCSYSYLKKFCCKKKSG